MDELRKPPRWLALMSKQALAEGSNELADELDAYAQEAGLKKVFFEE